MVVGVGFVGSWALSRSSVWCAFLWRSLPAAVSSVFPSDASPCSFAVLPCFLRSFGLRQLRGCVCGCLLAVGLSLSRRLSVCGACPFVSVFSLGFLVRGVFCVCSSWVSLSLRRRAGGDRKRQRALFKCWLFCRGGSGRQARSGERLRARRLKQNHRKRNQLADDRQAVGSRSLVFGRCRVRRKRQLV